MIIWWSILTMTMIMLFHCHCISEGWATPIIIWLSYDYHYHDHMIIWWLILAMTMIIIFHCYCISEGWATLIIILISWSYNCDHMIIWWSVLTMTMMVLLYQWRLGNTDFRLNFFSPRLRWEEGEGEIQSKFTLNWTQQNININYFVPISRLHFELKSFHKFSTKRKYKKNPAKEHQKD